MANKEKHKGDSILNFEIKNVRKKALPDSLCKYYCLSDNSVDSLVNSYFYTSHPADFNDPYDCLRKLSMQGEDAYGSYQLIFMYIGIICLSDNSDSMLMWAHYSGHNGFMINFNTIDLKQIFSSIYPINYVSKLPSINRDNIGKAVMTSANIKSIKWKYEKEWRCFHIPKIPMQFPSSNHSLMKFGAILFEREKIQPIERKLQYDKSLINYISIGYKLITDEEHSSNIATDSLEFNLKCENKKKLIDFLIDNDIPTKMTDLGNVDDFELINRPAKLTRTNNQKFEYKIQAAPPFPSN